MKSLLVIVAIAVLFTGCASTGTGTGSTNPLDSISQNIDPYASILARDYPKARGLIDGLLPPGVLPKWVEDKMEIMDKWFQDEAGNWLPQEQLETLKLNWYQQYFIAGARVAQTGPVMKATFEQFAPGLLGFPAVMNVLTFMGLGVL